MMADKKNEQSEMPEVDFKGLIMGLSGAALHYMCETKQSPGGANTVNLPLARQNIEIIAMLSEKTKGNLNADEEALMQQVLLDLRMRFIEKSKSHS